MRNALLVIGVILLLAGALVVGNVLTFTDREEVLRVGDASVSVSEEKPVDRTLGYVLLGLGALGVVAGIAMRR